MEFLEEIEQAVELISTSGTIRLLGQSESDTVLKLLKNTFVIDSPSNLWHSFSKPVLPVEAVNDEAIQDFINDKFDLKQLVYLILEEDNYYVLELEPKLAFQFLRECRYVIYYILDKLYKKLLCENDHNEVMYIEC